MRRRNSSVQRAGNRQYRHRRFVGKCRRYTDKLSVLSVVGETEKAPTVTEQEGVYKRIRPLFTNVYTLIEYDF